MAKSEKFSRAGYRIHFDRLKDVRSAASAIRTHKFKCEIPSKEAESELKGKFDENFLKERMNNLENFCKEII